MTRLRICIAAAVLAMLAISIPGSGTRVDVAHIDDNQPLVFAVIGDSGTGMREQWDVAHAMEEEYARRPFEMVLMLGDNIYGGIKGPQSFLDKFEKPYALLLKNGVRFYAALGNHGEALKEIEYEKFNMSGKRYYTFTRHGNLAQFFAIDSNEVDAKQAAWLEKELAASTAEWKIAFFHHPIYSSARKHGSNVKLRAVLEPLFVHYGVTVVLSGHDHVYERMKLQQGILHFVCGASGKIRENNLDRSDPAMAAGNDQDSEFMIFELRPSKLEFQAISGKGQVLDAGGLQQGGAPAAAAK
jgi:calcineurin-like phosphoesterase family protein